MPYDEGAAERVRTVPAGHAGVSEQRMFGGLAFLWNGNVACGVLDYELVVRVAPDAYDDSFEWGHARLTGGKDLVDRRAPESPMCWPSPGGEILCRKFLRMTRGAMG